MKRKIKNIALLLSLGVFLIVSCTKKEQESQVSNVSFTPCQQNTLRSAELSSKVDVAFTNKGVQITYHDFEVTCDFSTVNVTHTFVNGFLNITQQGSPNQANCVCHTDVSYTISGISQNEVNVIFINGVQVYCHNDNNGNEEELVGKRNVEALNRFVEDNQYSFSLGYIFNEYANEDLIISYMPNNGASTLRGFAIIRNGIVYNTTFNISRAGGDINNVIECIWNGNYVTVAEKGSYNDESTGLYGFQINNDDLSQPAVKLWQNTDFQLNWVKIYPFSEEINGNYYFIGERNATYSSSFRCNMATGEVLFTDAAYVFRTFIPIVYANGKYYGALYIGSAGQAATFCVASASQYYNNTELNTQQLSVSNITSWNPVCAFDFGKKRSVITTNVNQPLQLTTRLFYPVYLSNGEIDRSVPGLPSQEVFKYKGKSYLLQKYKQLVEIDDISYLFDDKYVTLPASYK